MRPKGVIGLLIILAIFVALGYFFTDTFIEGKIEDVGQSIVGAKVEIDNLKFSFLDLSISMDRLQVTNPNDTWKNLFEAGRIAFDMELSPLARKKVIINDVTVADVRIGTQRETDGQLPAGAKSEPPAWLTEASEDLRTQIANAPILNLGLLKTKINVDSLIAIADIKSAGAIDSLQRDAKESFTKWQNSLASFDPQNELEPIGRQIKEISAAKIEKAEELIETLDKVNATYNALNALRNDLEEKKQGIGTDINRIAASFAQIDNWIKADLDAIKARANLAELSPQNIAKMLFGDIVLTQSLEALEYVALARKYMPVAEQFLAAGKVEKPPRFEGQDIKFPLENAQPDFLLEHIFVSAATNQSDTSTALKASGEVKGVTSQPGLYGHPLTFALKARLPNANVYELTGEFDHTREIPEDRFELKASGLKIGQITLPQKPYMPAFIRTEKGDLNAVLSFIGDQLDLQIGLTARNVDFQFATDATAQNVISKITKEVFDSVDQLTLSANFSGLIGDFKLEVRSNIDNILAERMSGIIGESSRLARVEIDKKVNAIVVPKKDAALASLARHKQELEKKIDQIEKPIRDQISALEKKKQEFQVRIANLQKQGVKDVADKLKGLLKKN